MLSFIEYWYAELIFENTNCIPSIRGMCPPGQSGRALVICSRRNRLLVVIFQMDGPRCSACNAKRGRGGEGERDIESEGKRGNDKLNREGE